MNQPLARVLARARGLLEEALEHVEGVTEPHYIPPEVARQLDALFDALATLDAIPRPPAVRRPREAVR